MKVYFAADHAGLELKNELLSFVRGEMGFLVDDCGAHEYDESDDYPIIIARAARALAHDVQVGIEARAILIGASGQGEAMAANRFERVRAAVYYGPVARLQVDAGEHYLDMIASVRSHNDANALALGARFITIDEARDVVRTWLTQSFSGEERHVRRIAELDTVSTMHNI